MTTETGTFTLTEFLTARLGEDETLARNALHSDAVQPGAWVTEHHDSEYQPNWAHIAEDRMGNYWSVAHEVFIPVAEHIARHDPSRVLAEVAAKRRIVELHKSWPVLVQRPMEFETDSTEPDRMTFRATQQMAWLTEQEYRTRFGDEPPTSAIIRALASVYADHPDYRQEWS